jgi:hypothetical protein
VLSAREAARLRLWIDLSQAPKECGGEVGADTGLSEVFKQFTVHGGTSLTMLEPAVQQLK